MTKRTSTRRAGTAKLRAQLGDAMSQDNPATFLEFMAQASFDPLGSAPDLFDSSAHTAMEAAMEADKSAIFDSLLGLALSRTPSLASAAEAMQAAMAFCVKGGGASCARAILRRDPLLALLSIDGELVCSKACARRCAKFFDAVFDSLGFSFEEGLISKTKLFEALRESALAIVASGIKTQAAMRRLDRIALLGFDWRLAASPSGDSIFMLGAWNQKQALASDELCVAMLSAGASADAPCRKISDGLLSLFSSAERPALCELLFAPNDQFSNARPLSVRWMISNLPTERLFTLCEPLLAMPFLHMQALLNKGNLLDNASFLLARFEQAQICKASFDGQASVGAEAATRASRPRFL